MSRTPKRGHVCCLHFKRVAPPSSRPRGRRWKVTQLLPTTESGQALTCLLKYFWTQAVTVSDLPRGRTTSATSWCPPPAMRCSTWRVAKNGRRCWCLRSGAPGETRGLATGAAIRSLGTRSSRTRLLSGLARPRRPTTHQPAGAPTSQRSVALDTYYPDSTLAGVQRPVAPY